MTQLPPAYRPDFPLFIFHRPEHLALQAPHWETFYLLKRSRTVMAQASFHLKDGIASSPVRAPFGSYLFSPGISPLGLYDFILYVEKELKKRGVRHVGMTDPPIIYRDGAEMFQTLLLNLGYRVSRAEISSVIHVDKRPFLKKIAPGEAGKLKLATRKGVRCRRLPLSDLDLVYSFILDCRQERGYPSSMTREQLSETVSIFKKEFLLFGAFLDKELAAVSIAIRVHPGILYNFNIAHAMKFNSLSPALAVMNGMYQYCKKEGVRLLDLGTSAKEGQPNFSLLDFKLRLGAQPSMKLTFEKDFV